MAVTQVEESGRSASVEQFSEVAGAPRMDAAPDCAVADTFRRGPSGANLIGTPLHAEVKPASFQSSQRPEVNRPPSEGLQIIVGIGGDSLESHVSCYTG